MKTRVLSAAVILLSACTPAGTRPHDMSIEEHRQAARDLEEEASRDKEQESLEIMGDNYTDLWTLAAGYGRHASMHREAAAQLEAEHYPKACVGGPREHLESCPLSSHRVLSVKPVEKGVMVEFESVAQDEFEAHMMCHRAHMELPSNHADIDSCPLGPEVEVSVASSARGVRVSFVSEDKEVQERLRTLYVPVSNSETNDE